MTTGQRIATELGIPIDDEPTTYPERAERVVRAEAGVSDEPKFTQYAFIAEFIRWVDDTNGNDKSQLLSLYEDAKSELAKARGESPK